MAISFTSGTPASAPFVYSRDRAGLVLYRDNPVQYDWQPTLAYAKTYGVANPLNQLASAGGVALAFDVRGNLTSDGTFTYAYDQRNRMTSAVKAGMTAAGCYSVHMRKTIAA